MKNISNTLLCLLLAISANTSFGQNVELTKLGTAAFTPDGGSTTLSYTQTSTTLTFTAFNQGNLENYLPGTFTAGILDWTTYTNAPYVTFGLNMSVSGTNPETDFTFDLIDSGFNTIASYSGGTTGLGGTLSLVELTQVAVGSGAFNDIAAVAFTWNGTMGSPNTVTVESVYAVVPEPSTYALLALSGLALGGYTIRRRRRA